MNQSGENQLIEEILQGNQKAFEHLVNKHYSMVFSIAVRLLECRPEAEELAQDVFVKIYQSLHAFNRRSKLSTWIYRITYNTAITKLRAMKKMHQFKIIDHDIQIADQQKTWQETTIENEELQIVNQAINKLDETDRIIVFLFYYEDLSLKEISSIIDLTEQNVKIRLFRSRKKLHDLLKSKVDQIKSL